MKGVKEKVKTLGFNGIYFKIKDMNKKPKS
jgi:hypothetical protein